MPTRKGAAVREPVQVYLATDDRKLLDRIAAKAGLSRAEVLRRGIRRVAADVLADESPMLAFMDGQAKAPSRAPKDAAEHHDRYLTDQPKKSRRRRP